MQLIIQPRAAVALRSLQKSEQRQIERALNELTDADRADLRTSHKFYTHVSRFTGEKLFIYKGNIKYRLVLSFQGDVCVVEDIVDHDRLQLLIKREGQG